MTSETKIKLFAALALDLVIAVALTVVFMQATSVRAAVRPTAPVREVIIPIDGVQVAQLSDTWGQARSEGRRHEGIDIMAPRGSAVHAAAPGTIAKLFTSKRGGITVYQFDDSGRFILYYAHLDHYAADLKEGARVGQGQVIGYVGSTGNATTPHLHFETQRVGAARQWWKGEAFNPYLVLTAGRME